MAIVRIYVLNGNNVKMNLYTARISGGVSRFLFGRGFNPKVYDGSLKSDPNPVKSI